MLRKILMLVVSLMFVSSMALAVVDEGGESNTGTVIGNYHAEAWDLDESYSFTFNDHGYAGGEYMIGGKLDTFADAEGYSCKLVHDDRYPNWMWWKVKWEYTPNEAYQEGSIKAESEAKAWSWAKDYGLTSKAGAGIKAEDGYVRFEAWVSGRGGDDESIRSQVLYGADFIQHNAANEIGYAAGGVSAGNESGLYFYGVTPYHDWSGLEMIASYFGLMRENYTPDVITKGKSEVTIDPYGDYRSIVAHTENMSDISFPGGSRCNPSPSVYLQEANVWGNGNVNGVIGNGGAFAGGSASFNYSGYTNGSGSADMNAYVNTHGDTTKVFVSGSSRAVANGNNLQF